MRLQVLQDALDNGGWRSLEQFSPLELYEALLTRGQSDDEVTRYVRIASELGVVFLHPGVTASREEDAELEADVLQCVFPEMTGDEAQPLNLDGM